MTGEEVLELHIHGGPATVRAVLNAIPRCPSSSNIRSAEPGEFTRRAFQNNRLDLAQVEALSDTLSAETEQQRLAAVRGNSGVLGKSYEVWRKQLLYARGELEALIDFSEDQQFDESPGQLLRNVSSQVQDISKSISSHIKASHQGELLRKGIRISLLGPPNAGKSSLLNRIVGREASIVSQEAGTTRDVVEVSLDIRGYLCTLADTAGLRQMQSKHSPGVHNESLVHLIGDVEQEGIRRAKLKAIQSDVVIVLASIESSDAKTFHICYDQEALEIAVKAPAALILINKIDKIPDKSRLSEMTTTFSKQILSSLNETGRLKNVVPISCGARPGIMPIDSTSENVETFLDLLVRCFQDLTSSPIGEEDLLGVTERQRQLLSHCLQNLHDFIEEASIDSEDCDVVLSAEYLRTAANCLSRITGRGEAGDVEEVLGVVFEKYVLFYISMSITDDALVGFVLANERVLRIQAQNIHPTLIHAPNNETACCEAFYVFPDTGNAKDFQDMQPHQRPLVHQIETSNIPSSMQAALPISLHPRPMFTKQYPSLCREASV